MQLFYGTGSKPFYSYWDGYTQDDLDSFYSAWEGNDARIAYVYRAPDREDGDDSYTFRWAYYDLYRDRKKCIVADVYYRGRQVQAHGGRLNLLFLDGHVKSTNVVVPDSDQMGYGTDSKTTTTFETYFDPEY